MTKLAQWLGISRYRADERYLLALQAFSQRDLGSAQVSIAEALELLPGHAEYHAVQVSLRKRTSRWNMPKLVTSAPSS